MGEELTRYSKVGDHITWSTVGGEIFFGVLTQWDNGTAIVSTKDGLKAVRAER